jgi:hypothetical protein
MNERKLSCDLADAVFKDGILRINYKGLTADLNEVKAFISALKVEFADVMPVLFISDITKQKSPNKEVRDYMGSPEVLVLTKAGAIIAGSILSKIVGNLYLSFNKPTIPTKIFSDEASALQWLEQFRK